jgi:hypothetical protein
LDRGQPLEDLREHGKLAKANPMTIFHDRPILQTLIRLRRAMALRWSIKAISRYAQQRRGSRFAPFLVAMWQVSRSAAETYSNPLILMVHPAGFERAAFAFETLWHNKFKKISNNCFTVRSVLAVCRSLFVAKSMGAMQRWRGLANKRRLFNVREGNKVIRMNLRIVRCLASAYVEFVRDTPLLIQLFFLFYVLPYYGITLPALTVGIVSLGLNYSAYTAEV